MEDLRALLIVSDLCVVDEQGIGEAYRSAEIPGLLVGVSRAKGEKCNRCWNYSGTVGANANVSRRFALQATTAAAASASDDT